MKEINADKDTKERLPVFNGYKRDITIHKALATKRIEIQPKRNEISWNTIMLMDTRKLKNRA